MSNRLPNLPVAAFGGLAIAVIVATAAVRFTGVGASHVADSPTVEMHELRFEDRADGSIVVLDGSGRRVVETVAPGSNGFLRGTMRGLARERHRQGIGAELPFRMIGRADGKLMLEDPGTGRHVDLGSFGPTNGAVFGAIMIAARHPQTPLTTAGLQ